MMESINKARAMECDTPEDFLEILNKHDWYYDYSDDHRVWTRGHDNWKLICRIREKDEMFEKIYQAYIQENRGN